MGRGYGCICVKCGYHLLGNFGVGFMFPQVYHETIERARKGELGDTYKRFFQENKNAAINCENVMLQCTDCGEYEIDLELTAYLKKPDFQKERNAKWSVAFPFPETEYVTLFDLTVGYTKRMDYPHKCHKCNGKMRIIREKQFYKMIDNNEFLCPNCEMPMELTEIMNWD